MFQFMLPTKGQSAIWRLTDFSFILIFNVEKILRASQIYQRYSGFSTQLWYRFIRRPQSKETSPHDISSEVPKSSVTKLKGPHSAPSTISTAINSTQHRLLWTTTCYFCVPCFHNQTLLLPTALLSLYSQVPNAVTYCLHLEEPNVMCSISPTLHINLLQTKILHLHKSRVSKFQGTHDPFSNNGQK